jgi:DNA-binding NarL/FixJ family response regulator
MNKIRVLLADDHPALCLGLRVLVENAPDMELVGEVNNGEEALTLLERERPDVVMLDCELPGLTGTEVAQEIQIQGWATRVLALSAYDDDVYVHGMLDAGAMGYLLKGETPQAILAAVRAVAQGKGWFSPAVAARMTAWVHGKPGSLTERESEVLHLVTDGLTNKQIARQLGVTESTVEFHVGNVLQKLGVTSRVAAAVWAKEHGIA